MVDLNRDGFAGGQIIYMASRLSNSMGRVASAGDNSAIESLFSLLQNDVLNSQRWQTREDLHLAFVTWIERTHHRKCRQRGPRKTKPIELETLDLVSTVAQN
jgi:hypothetical protein